MQKQLDWIQCLLKRLCDVGYIQDCDIILYESFYNIKAFVELSSVDKVFVLLRDYKKSVAEAEQEMWRVKNEFFKRKNGKKLIAVCMLFDLQFKKKPYVDYDEERKVKLKLLSSYIANFLEKNYKEY